MLIRGVWSAENTTRINPGPYFEIKKKNGDSRPLTCVPYTLLANAIKRASVGIFYMYAGYTWCIPENIVGCFCADGNSARWWWLRWSLMCLAQDIYSSAWSVLGKPIKSIRLDWNQHRIELTHTHTHECTLRFYDWSKFSCAAIRAVDICVNVYMLSQPYQIALLYY